MNSRFLSPDSWWGHSLIESTIIHRNQEQKIYRNNCLLKRIAARRRLTFKTRSGSKFISWLSFSNVTKFSLNCQYWWSSKIQLIFHKFGPFYHTKSSFDLRDYFQHSLWEIIQQDSPKLTRSVCEFNVDWTSSVYSKTSPSHNVSIVQEAILL